MREISKLIVGVLAVIGGIFCTVLIGAVIHFYVDTHWGEKEELAIVDCGWDDTASAWIDENEDGVWDSNERPLGGVRFIADNVNFDDYLPDDSFSDENGKAKLFVFPLDCNKDNAKIILYAVPPNDYKSTTAWRIIVPTDAVNNSESDDFRFGFALENQ